MRSEKDGDPCVSSWGLRCQTDHSHTSTTAKSLRGGSGESAYSPPLRSPSVSRYRAGATAPALAPTILRPAWSDWDSYSVHRSLKIHQRLLKLPSSTHQRSAWTSHHRVDLIQLRIGQFPTGSGRVTPRLLGRRSPGDHRRHGRPREQP